MSVATERAREARTSGRTTPRNEVVMLFDSTLPISFWSKLYAHPSGCWLWEGGQGGKGYGSYTFPRSQGKRTEFVHRLVYSEFFTHPPPGSSGLQIDHLCRTRRCASPLHLELVTAKENHHRGLSSENLRRKTHCPKGHPYSGDNLRIYIDKKRGGAKCRRCKECMRRDWRARYYRNRAALKEEA